MSKPQPPEPPDKAATVPVAPPSDADAADESVAGEEDPGSALEQFRELMQDLPGAGDAGNAAAREQAPDAREAAKKKPGR